LFLRPGWCCHSPPKAGLGGVARWIPSTPGEDAHHSRRSNHASSSTEGRILRCTLVRGGRLGAFVNYSTGGSRCRQPSCPRVQTLSVVACLGQLISACHSPGASSAVVSRDSAGIEVVENSPEGTIEIPVKSAISGQVVLPTGELTGVRAVLPLDSSTLMIAQVGAPAILLIRPGGESGVPAGRGGHGPGEYSGVRGLFACATDTVVVHSNSARLSFLAAQGRFVRMLERPSYRGDVLGISQDCAASVRVDLRPTAPPGQMRVPGLEYVLSWYAGAADSAVMVAVIPGPELGVATLYGRPTPVPLPFGRMPSITSFGDLVYVGAGTAPEVQVYRRGIGLVRIIRWEAEPDPVTQDDRIRHDQIITEIARIYGTEGTADYPPTRAFSIPATKPLFSRMLVSRNGDLWVQRYPDVWEGFERTFGRQFMTTDGLWWVFDPAGELRGLYRTPRDLFVRAVLGDALFGVRTDEDGFDALVRATLVPELVSGAVPLAGMATPR